MRRPLWTVGVSLRQPGEKDRHGNVTYTYADPVDVEVYAISPSFSTEPATGRMEVTSGLMIYAPVDALHPGPHDRLVIDDVVWELDGEVADFSRGPYGDSFGVTYTVKKVEG